MKSMYEKISWEGRIIGVQPRIRLLRSFDQRNHNYMGYSLLVSGVADGQERELLVGIGKAAQAKHQFKAGDVVRGDACPVLDSRTEVVEFYKTSKLDIIERAGPIATTPPSWIGIPPELEIYRQRGHRRLDARTYAAHCRQCIWGCLMPVEMIIDQWKPDKIQYRTETFCYGPKSCSLYKAGPTRKVPGRKGMTWEEEDWVDEEATAHRGMDD
jgi:hypothetical protein